MKQQDQNTMLLKAALKKGDKVAFKKIFELHHEKLTIYVKSFSNNSNEAEDVVQETFIKLWNGREKFEIENSIIGFLYKTAYYTFVDKYRKKKREAAALDMLAHNRLMELVEEDIETKENRIKSINEAIELLPKKCKQIFVMSKIEQYRYQEIADFLNISVKTVEAHMGNAFTSIRKHVRKK